jgi:hypothetical protein
MYWYNKSISVGTYVPMLVQFLVVRKTIKSDKDMFLMLQAGK